MAIHDGWRLCPRCGTELERVERKLHCPGCDSSYYANSEIARLFVAAGRDLVAPGGRVALVTKVPREVVPDVLDRFADVATAEARGYTVVVARVNSTG